MSYVNITENLVTLCCCRCQIRFAVMQGLYDRLQRSKDMFFCPIGHEQGFLGPNAVERERDSLKLQLASANASAERAREARDRAERRRSAAKGQLTKTRNRIAAGVCPCCSRTFQNLQAHMRTQHAGYVHQEPEEADQP